MDKALDQIETVVMLMLENRSLDNVLGWLYDNDRPAHVFPAGSPAEFDGLNNAMSNHSGAREYFSHRGTANMPQPLRVPRFDPNEEYEHVARQLYGDADGTMPERPWDQDPPMTGFASDYDALYVDPAEVMGAYDPSQLPVLNGLARRFAVSDRWFASVPTQTNANRAFSICGTSLGAVDNADLRTYETKTIFDVLTGIKSWGMYWQWDGFQTGDPGPAGGCYSADLFPNVRRLIDDHKGELNPYASFLEALGRGDEIPQFCYLEPHWGVGRGYPTGFDYVGVQGNDYHPPCFLGPAEHDLSVLFDALRTSKQWKNMLFIITFDEHGGTYDHARPTPTIAPDEHRTKPGIEPPFDFTRLGVRIPTILVTPFVEPGTVFRAPAGSPYDFDHTSTISTLLKWAGVDPASAGLGARVAVAPSFESVLCDEAHLDTEHIDVPGDYNGQGGGLGLHLGLELGDLDPVGLGIEIWRHIAERSDSVDDFIHHLRHAKDAPAS